jgi:hypothetical protein
MDFLELVCLAGPTSVGVVGVGISTRECRKEAKSYRISYNRMEWIESLTPSPSRMAIVPMWEVSG